MTKEQAEFIKATCDHVEIECELRKGYSGRGMYGKETWGVVVPSVLGVLGAVVDYLKAGTGDLPRKTIDAIP